MKKILQWFTFNLISIAAFAVGHTVTITQANIHCNGDCDGTASAIVSGGVGPFVYSWSNGSTGINATGLCAATYSCTVTDNSDFSIVTSVIAITEPSAITLSTTSIPTPCGLTTGVALVSVTGGSPQFVYSWSNGATSQTINNLAEGAYTVSVTDANACIKSSMVNIIAIVEHVYASSLSDVTCYGGNNGSAGTTGGTIGFSFNWSNGSTGLIATGLSAGTYAVTITDANGCKSISTATIREPAAITVNTFSTDAACGMPNGTANAIASGGTGLLTYSWNTGSSNYLISALSASVYTVTITDANGCKSISTVAVTEPAAPLSLQTPSATSTGCGTPTGTATASASGGTGTLTYLWNPGSRSGATITGLPAGIYTLTVTDANGCIATGTATVSPSGGQQISIDTQKDLKCYGGSNGNVYTSIYGGSGNCSYTWSTGLSGTGCSSSIINVSAGTYTVSYTEINTSCTTTKVISISEPPPIVITTTISNATNCNTNGASVIANVSGGTGAYIYSWSDGSSGITASNLGCSTYTLSVSDANSCIATTAVVVSDVIGINELNNEIDFIIYPSPATNSITIEATTNKPYIVQLTNLLGETVYRIQEPSTGKITIDVSTFPKGIYIVQVTDTENNSSGRQRLIIQ